MPVEDIRQCATCNRSYVVPTPPALHFGQCERHRAAFRLMGQQTQRRVHGYLQRLSRRYPDGVWKRLPGWQFVDEANKRSCTLDRRTKKLYWDDTREVVRLKK